MKTLVIAPADAGKGRTFEAVALGWVHAPMLLEDGANTMRPIWLMYAGSDEALRAVTANLRLGRRAELQDGKRSLERIELLKSLGYQYQLQRTSAGTVVTTYLPDLFRLDPGMVDPRRVAFCVLPPWAWVVRNAPSFEVPSMTEHLQTLQRLAKDRYRPTAALASLCPLATLFAVHLDRRTRRPLVNDPRFHLQLLVAFLDSQHARMSIDSASRNSYQEKGLEDVGLLPGVGFTASHDVVDRVLAHETEVFFEVTKQRARGQGGM